MDHFILERIVKKSQYQLYKKWTEAGVGASRATMLQERSHNCHIPIIGALLNERRQTCHTWAKEKNYWTRAQWSKVAIYQEILDHFMLSSAEKLYEDAKSFSSRKVQNTTKGFAKHAITVLQCSSQLSWHQSNRTFKKDEKQLKLISSSQAGLQ